MRLIDADALIDFFSNIQEELGAERISFKSVNRAIDAMTTIDIEPKRGEWIHHKSFDMGHKNCEPCRECSCCHTWYQYDGIPKLNFCPNCGADMREREGE